MKKPPDISGQHCLPKRTSLKIYEFNNILWEVPEPILYFCCGITTSFSNITVSSKACSRQC